MTNLTSNLEMAIKHNKKPSFTYWKENYKV